MANIAIAKMGKTISFNFEKHGPIGGDIDCPSFIYAIAKTYPEHDFWIIGRNDYSKVYPEGLLPNIHSIWNEKCYSLLYEPGIKPWSNIDDNDYESHPEDFENYYNYVENIFNKLNIKIDFAFIFMGMTFTVSQFNIKPIKNNKRDTKTYAKTILAATMYASFLSKWLNESKVPYVNIATDPRQYGTVPKDIVNQPLMYLSQIDEVFKYGSPSPLYYPKDISHDPVNIQNNIYSGIEILPIMIKEPIEKFPEKHGINLILNEGNTRGNNRSKSRYDMVNKWILSNKDLDCSIYGKWDESIIASDKRFKGPIRPIDLGSVLNTTKYTLCIPIEAGWITAKYLEMLHYGVIPFVTSEYASKVKEHYIPNELIIKTPDEMWKKIEFLDNNDDIYKKLLE